ncbi:MAG: hypothetical protein IPI35_24765 [Deltaproteobacteria bacterium]|nr:hypothetical protein [Deltaproteobacteria bacterium]
MRSPRWLASSGGPTPTTWAWSSPPSSSCAVGRSLPTPRTCSPAPRSTRCATCRPGCSKEPRSRARRSRTPSTTPFGHHSGKTSRRWPWRSSAARGASALAPILLAIAEVHGANADEPAGEIIERLPAPRRSAPPPGFDLDRGRQSRADLVLAVLRAHDVQLRDVERGRLRPVTRDDLAEAILRDPFWDDIDASVQEDGVVDGILRNGKPSPAIDLSAFGQPQVYIKRIVR